MVRAVRSAAALRIMVIVGLTGPRASGRETGSMVGNPLFSELHFAVWPGRIHGPFTAILKALFKFDRS
ncbi:hypothetical protein [Bradyrhizobium sp.]|uniref:hypothetical protein n=1 Tax=Bradyrhizobium sp. TaxID=376 RepID=UPI0025C5B14B|nr:hypothetical protein [Bradyrhizobium sp.]MBV8922735.1 hypothetical protein [Bradyrhizobium sp.]